jgi:hypothetical protein
MGGMKENVGGMNSSMIYLMYCKKFCKCHLIPPLSTTIKKKKERNIFMTFFLFLRYWGLSPWPLI